MTDDHTAQLLRELRTGDTPPLRNDGSTLWDVTVKRQARRRSVAAAGASGLLVAAIVTVPVAVSGRAHRTDARPGTTHSASVVADANRSALDSLQLPPGATRHADAPTPELRSNPAGTVNVSPSSAQSETAFWTSTQDLQAVTEWFSDHGVPGLTRGQGVQTWGTVTTISFSAGATATTVGPTVTVDLQAVGSSTAIRADATTITLPSKSPQQTLSGVSRVVLSAIDPSRKTTIKTLAVTAATAATLTQDVNALTAQVPGSSGCTSGQLNIKLEFTTSPGNVTILFDRNCNNVTTDVPGPALAPSSALDGDAAAALGIPE